MPIDAFSVLCAQLTRDRLAITKFSYTFAQHDESLFFTTTVGFAILYPRIKEVGGLA